MGSFKWTRSYFAMAATPLGPANIFLGHQLFIATRVLVSAIAYLAVIAAFGGIQSWLAVFAPLAALLTGVAFSAPIAAYAATAESDNAFSAILRFAIVPMFLFSGTFFPIDQLPAALQVLAVLSPMWHAVELCRGATTGTLGAGPAAVHVAYLTAWVVVGRWYGSRTFAAKLAP
jgi:lipooligosaccharide transport system permease protein